MLQFKVVCIKNDVGIFTCYGAKVCHSCPTPVDPGHPHPHPGPYGPAPYHHPGPPMPGPSFKDKVRYDVVFYTNPELTQSLVIYSDKNINVCRLVLNNFIKMALSGMNIIDVDRINDRTPIELIERKHGHFCDDDCDPFYNPWDQHWRDHHKNPFVDVFDYTGDKPCGIPGPDMPHDECRPNCVYEDDLACHPMADGDEMCFHPPGWRPPHHHPCPPFAPWDPHHGPFGPRTPAVERAITRVIPNTLERILHEVTPPERQPEHRHDIVYYYGNAGIAFGGSVVNNLSEISKFALGDMLRKNGYPTFSTSNDRIDIRRMISRTILETDVFTVNKTTDNDWAFFMIPDKHINLINNFNFYYQEDSVDNEWVEVTDESKVQRQFTIQNNGIRYYIVAMKMTGFYAVKFAKSGLTSDQIKNGTNVTPPENQQSSYTGGNTDWTGSVVFRVTGNTLPANVNFSYMGEGDETATDIYFNNSLTVNLTGLEDGKEYVISKTVDGVTTPMVYFIVYQQMDGKTSLLSKDSADSEYVARPNNFIVVTV